MPFALDIMRRRALTRKAGMLLVGELIVQE